VKSFVRSNQARFLDGLAQRYSVRPSSLIGIPPELGHSLLFDMALAVYCSEQERTGSATLGGEIQNIRNKWDSEAREELRRGYSK